MIVVKSRRLVVWAATVAVPAVAVLAVAVVLAPGRAGAQAEPADEALPPWLGTTETPAPECFSPPLAHTDARPRPSAGAVRGLREMEAEAERTTRAGRSYQAELDALLAHELERGRRHLSVEYGRRIADEASLAGEARDRAIVLFERFVARHPDDAEHTPDAMFRLGQLYYERAVDRFAAAGEAHEGDASEAEHPDLAPVIALYRALLERFPGFRARAGVLYLLGYCLGETGELEEALAAWQALVCDGRFAFPPSGEETVAPAAGDVGASLAHPSLTLDAPALGPEIAYTGVDPYAGCTVTTGAAELAAETWLRIGEHHFDFDGGPGFLDRAIAAYRRVLELGTGRAYDLALYKLAWSHYRASRYPEAIEHFAHLVERADSAPSDGAAASLRPEAIEYLALTFAYDDWDEDGTPDTRTDPGATGLARATDPALLPQDRPYTREVLTALAQVYFEEARYELAIATGEAVLARWPLSPNAPDVARAIARAQAQRGGAADTSAREEREDEFAVRFGPGSPWAAANPAAAERIEALVEEALLGRAVRHHLRATELRHAAAGPGNGETAARAEYAIAIDAYQRFLAERPNSPEAYDVSYDLAEALYWSGRFGEAAQAYAVVRDSTFDDGHLADAARRVVLSYERIADEAVNRGDIALRDRGPEPDPSGHVATVPLPEPLANVARAREVYLARVGPERDADHLREAFAFNQALLLTHYGHWDDARDRFWALYVTGCQGEDGGASASDAWTRISEMATVLNDEAELRRLTGDVRARACTGEALGRAAAIEGVLDFREGVRRFRDAEARAATGDADGARALYEQASATLLDAVGASPEHEQAPLALLLAASALERSGHDGAAVRVYGRVVDEVGPITTDQPARQAELDGILGTAYLGLATSARRALDYDAAVLSYGAVADSLRFARSTSADVPAMIEEAVVNGAQLSAALARYEEAARYYRRAADLLDDPAEARTAAFLAAEMAYRAGDWTATATEMTAFLDAHGTERDGASEVVTAAWRIAEAREATHASERARRAALERVVERFDALGGTPRSEAAEYAAGAAFLLAEPSLDGIDAFAIAPGRPATLDAYVATLADDLTRGVRLARAASDRFTTVIGYERTTWTVAALGRQGRAWERLAIATLEAPFVMPTALERSLRSLPPAEREEIRAHIEDEVRQSLEPWTRAFECTAVTRYVIAARAARLGALDDEGTRFAHERLGRYGEERIAECIDVARAGDTEHGVTADPSLSVYVPGELARAPRGATVTVPIDEASVGPALAE